VSKDYGILHDDYMSARTQLCSKKGDEDADTTPQRLLIMLLYAHNDSRVMLLGRVPLPNKDGTDRTMTVGR